MAEEVQDNNSPAAQQALAAERGKEQANQGAADDAKKKVDVPGDVTTNNGEDIGKILADHAKRTTGNQEIFTKLGVKNYQQFADQVRSNPVFAMRVADLYLAGEGEEEDVHNYYGAAGLILDMNAPQENNITGTVDHTGDVATKLHVDGEAKQGAVVEDTDGIKAGTVSE